MSNQQYDYKALIDLYIKANRNRSFYPQQSKVSR